MFFKRKAFYFIKAISCVIFNKIINFYDKEIRIMYHLHKKEAINNK